MATAKENVRAVVKAIAQVLAQLNVQVLVVKHVQVAAVKDVAVDALTSAHLIANLNVKEPVALVVQGAHILVLEHVRASAEMLVGEVAMAPLVSSNGKY